MSLCFATCIESGPLEELVPRWAESVRRFGGAHSKTHLMAVAPRIGSPISRRTRERLRDLDVDLVVSRRVRSYGWYHFLNKPLTLQAAERLSGAEVIAWFDADTLVTAEPNSIMLPSDVDFTAAAPDNDIVGSSGVGDPHEPMWRFVCGRVGLQPDDLPWLVSHVERRRIRLYWQGGVFAYRRSTGYASCYLETCLELLRARVVWYNGAQWLEQMAIGLAMVRMGLRWYELPGSYNYCVASFLREQFDPEQFRRARVIHYHDAMNAHFWCEWLEYLRKYQPHVFEWIKEEGPLANRTPTGHRVVNEALRMARGIPRRVHRMRSRTLVPPAVDWH